MLRPCLLALALLAGCYQPTEDLGPPGVPPVGTSTGHASTGTAGATSGHAATGGSGHGPSASSSTSGATSSSSASTSSSSASSSSASTSTSSSSSSSSASSSSASASSSTSTSSTGGTGSTIGGTTGGAGGCGCHPETAPLTNGDMGQPCTGDQPGGEAQGSCAAGEFCESPADPGGVARCTAHCDLLTCPVGLCLDQAPPGAPPVYRCVAQCTPARGGCPSGLTCTGFSPDPDELGVCQPPCASDAACNPPLADGGSTAFTCSAGVCRCTSDADCAPYGLACDPQSGNCHQACQPGSSCGSACCATFNGASYCDWFGRPMEASPSDGGLLIGEDCSGWWDHPVGPNPCDCGICMNTTWGKICVKQCGGSFGGCPYGWGCSQWYPSPGAMGCFPQGDWVPHPAGGAPVESECFVLPAARLCAAPPACAARCADLGAECGPAPDGCGGTLDCGACPGGLACGPDGRCAGLHWSEVSLPDVAPNLVALAGNAAELWAVGTTAVYRDTGAGLTRLPDPPSQLAFAAAPGGGVLLATSGGSLLVWDGAAWTPQNLSSAYGYNGVWAASPTDAWLTEGYGALVHYDGASLQNDTWAADAVYGVGGSGPGDVWAVGHSGEVFHYDGSGWAQLSVWRLGQLHAVWASGPADAWAVGFQGAVAHWDGAGWTRLAANTSADLASVWSAGAGAAWFVGGSSVFHWDGSAFSETPLPGVTLQAVWGRSATEVYAAGVDGQLHGRLFRYGP